MLMGGLYKIHKVFLGHVKWWSIDFHGNEEPFGLIIFSILIYLRYGGEL